ncbi:MAG: ATP-grasp domain-containing protein [Adhaeribacter sp.]
MKLALVTYADEGKYPGEGTREDAQLKEYLTKKGLDIKYEIWTDPNVNWQQYEAIILKSPWDYFDKVDLFQNWLNNLDQKKVRVLNPTSVVRWNLNKEYLLQVEKAGFATVPTSLLKQQRNFKAAPFFEIWNTDSLIVKPVVSGGAKNTFVISQSEAGIYENQLNQLLQEEAFLVQPFIPEIQSKGEYSLIFFNGYFSHCVLKVPQHGDFRVQHYFGGAIIPTSPPTHILEYAQHLLKQFAPGSLYARVDGLESNGKFRLMELELIEPLLYLLYHEKAFENYYQALRQIL